MTMSTTPSCLGVADFSGQTPTQAGELRRVKPRIQHRTRAVAMLTNLKHKASKAAMSVATMAAAMVAVMAASGAAQAALFDRGGGMVYDSTLNITWLADWNYAQTSGFDADGLMKWSTANTWANNLVYGGYDDWRLPTALNANGSGPCGPAYNCSGSEMGHMFYTNWGASAGSGFATGTNSANLALFSKVQAFIYWSGTAYAQDPISAWHFNTYVGLQEYDTKGLFSYAVAVRPGDVAAVPEPQTYLLLLLGLGLVLGVARRDAWLTLLGSPSRA